MDIQKLKRLQAEEDERTTHQAGKVARQHGRKGATWAVREIYADKIKLPAGHTYHQSGSLALTAFLGEKTVVEVFPFDNPDILYKEMGLRVDEIRTLAKEHIIEVLIHSYPDYEGLDYLDPILNLRPACYQSRGRAFLNAISEGGFDEWFEIGRKAEFVRSMRKTGFVREPYEKKRSISIAEIRRKTAWRFAAMCCLIGKETIDDIVEAHRDRAANYINELHTVFLHPITHGMLGDPFNSVLASRDLHDRKYVEILDSIERIMIDEIGLVLPSSISAAMILRSHEQGLARDFSRLRNTTFREVVQDITSGVSTIEDVKLHLEGHFAELNDQMHQIESSEKMAERGLVLGLLAGGTVCMGQGFGTLAALLFGSMQVAPFIVEPLAKAYARVFEPAISHYWSLKRVTSYSRQR